MSNVKKYTDKLNDDYLTGKLGYDILNSDRDYFQLLEKNIADFQKEENKKAEDAEKREADNALKLDKLLFDQRKYEDEIRREEEQTAFDNALKRWKTLGYLDSESAKILGLPEGTKIMGYK